MEKVLRLTVRLRDPHIVARVERYLRSQRAVGVSQNASISQLISKGFKEDERISRIETKIDDILNMQFVAVDDAAPGGVDEVETGIDDQFKQWE